MALTKVKGSGLATGAATASLVGIDDNATSTAITIDSSENVGIGVVPEAWHSSFVGVDYGASGSIFAHKTEFEHSLLNNAYYDGTWKYKNAAPATRIAFSATGADFFRAASGTADAALTWDAMASFTANGLTFNGDTAAANALDDYEEGTWTPVITMSVTAPSVTYTYQVGRYTKIGNIVTIYADMHWSSLSGGAGNARIVLPFTAMAAKYFKPETRSYGGLSVGVDTLPAGFTSNANLELQKISQSTGNEVGTYWHASGRYNFQITMMV
jgi:hypothetical protein